MSTGTPRVTIRIAKNLRELIEKHAKKKTKGGKLIQSPVSDWIRKAICEKLNHLARGQRIRRERLTKEGDEALKELTSTDSSQE